MGAYCGGAFPIRFQLKTKDVQTDRKQIERHENIEHSDGDDWCDGSGGECVGGLQVSLQAVGNIIGLALIFGVIYAVSLAVWKPVEGDRWYHRLLFVAFVVGTLHILGRLL
jgi:hypothetical protein